MSSFSQAWSCLVTHPTRLRHDIIAPAAEDKGSAVLYLLPSPNLNLSLSFVLLFFLFYDFAATALTLSSGGAGLTTILNPILFVALIDDGAATCRANLLCHFVTSSNLIPPFGWLTEKLNPILSLEPIIRLRLLSHILL